MNTVSNRALSDAIVVLNSEIKHLSALLESGEVDEELIEDTGEYVLQLQNSFGELVALYRARQLAAPGMATVEKLIGDELQKQ
jgi:hypothetical protein